MKFTKSVFTLALATVVSIEAHGQCVRRTPSIQVLAPAQAKVIPMAPYTYHQGNTVLFMAGFGYNKADHRIRITNNDDLACGASRLGVALGSVTPLYSSNPYVAASGAGVIVNPGQSMDLDVPEVLVSSMQPGSSALGEAHGCRGQLDVYGDRIWLSDCSAASTTQLNALQGPPLLKLNGDSNLNRGPQNPVVVSRSLRSFALNVSATTQEQIRQIRAWLGPVSCNANNECLWSNGDPREIMLCESGSQTCSASIKPNRLAPGFYRINVSATNQPDANGIHYGNQMTQIIQIQ